MSHRLRKHAWEIPTFHVYTGVKYKNVLFGNLSPFMRDSCVHSRPSHKGSAVASRALALSSCPVQGLAGTPHSLLLGHLDCNQLPRMLGRSSLSGSVVSYVEHVFVQGTPGRRWTPGHQLEKQHFFHKLVVIVKCVKLSNYKLQSACQCLQTCDFLVKKPPFLAQPLWDVKSLTKKIEDQ